MEKTEFLLLLDDLFELDAGTIGGGDTLQDIEGWSSLTLIGLIALIDDEFDLRIAPDSILNCRTVGGLIELLDGKVIGKLAA